MWLHLKLEKRTEQKNPASASRQEGFFNIWLKQDSAIITRQQRFDWIVERNHIWATCEWLNPNWEPKASHSFNGVRACHLWCPNSVTHQFEKNSSFGSARTVATDLWSGCLLRLFWLSAESVTVSPPQKVPFELSWDRPVACIINDVTIVNNDASVIIFTPLFVS